MPRNPCFNPIYLLLSCREKKDAEIVNLEGKKNQEMDDLRELEQVKKSTRTSEAQLSKITLSSKPSCITDIGHFRSCNHQKKLPY